MIRDEIALLLYEAKRKPAVAALVDRVLELTDEDIAAADVPLPWFRKALTALREKKRFETMQVDYVLTANPDPLGQVWRWMGDATYLPVGKSSIEIREGQLVWVGANDFWFDTVRGVRPPEWFFNGAERVGFDVNHVGRTVKLLSVALGGLRTARDRGRTTRTHRFQGDR